MSGEYKVPLFLYRPRCVIELDWSLNRFRLIHLHSPGTAPPAPGWWSVLGGNTLHEINAFDQHCLPIRVNGLFLWNIQLKIFRRANFALGAIHKPRGGWVRWGWGLAIFHAPYWGEFQTSVHVVYGWSLGFWSDFSEILYLRLRLSQHLWLFWLHRTAFNHEFIRVQEVYHHLRIVQNFRPSSRLMFNGGFFFFSNFLFAFCRQLDLGCANMPGLDTALFRIYCA